MAREQPSGDRPGLASPAQAPTIDRRRYLRVVRYFAGALLHLFFWDVILRALLGRERIQRSAEGRWIRLAAAVLFAALLLAAVALCLVQGMGPVNLVLFGLAVLAFLAALFRR